MDEKRLRELENWTLEERKGLTASENVLLDAIAETCLEIRRARGAEPSIRRELELVREELEKDRRVMEGVDVELAVREEDAAERARAILAERLDEHAKLGDAHPPSRPTLFPDAT